MKRFAVMGALDCVATTLQTFAAVYLPGPLLILLPQAAIPVSLALTAVTAAEGVSLQQWMGAGTVLLGIWIVWEPILWSRNAPDYYCEAQDRENDCTLCQTLYTEEDCLSATQQRHGSVASAYSTATATTLRWLEEVDPTNDEASPCQWLPFEESSQEKEFLEFFWSFALIASTFPMALSALYKQRAMLSVSAETTAAESPISRDSATAQNSSPPPPPAIYVSGWIAVFQFLCSMLISVPAGLLSSPSVPPWEVPSNLFHGMFCYAGVGFVETGCHPDTACSSSALWVNVTVLCHVVYTLSMMLVLKYSGSSPLLLFLALTAIVPIGHLFFALPFMPDRTEMQTSDLAGLIVILAGLVLYRFSALSPPPSELPATLEDETRPVRRKRHREAEERQAREHRRSQSISIADLFAARDDFDEDDTEEENLLHQQTSSMCLGSLWPVQNQTSYTLLRRDSTVTPRSEDV